MPEYLTGLAAWLQLLFTAQAEHLGRSTRFIRRQRQLTAGACAQTLVFRRRADGKATLELMAEERELSPQALHQHPGPAAQAWLRALLVEALRQAPRAALGLLDRFTAVLVEDTTVLALPAELAEQFPGGGGRGAGAAAVQVLRRWDVRDGALHELSAHAGRTSDHDLADQAGDLPAGGLHLADQGFFNTGRWLAFAPERYGIRRVPARTRAGVQGAWQALAALRAGVTGDAWGGPVGLVGQANLPCRLVARRCPAEVAGRRRQKLRASTRAKKGREPSAAPLQLWDGVTLATNVPAERLSANEVGVVYRCRWQVELLFQRAKGRAGWGFRRGRRGARVVVELDAKRLGLVVLPWGTLLRGGPWYGSRGWKRLRLVQPFAPRLQDSLSQGEEAVPAVLAQLQRRLSRIRPQAQSRKKPGTRQLLFNPDLVP